MHYTIPSIVAAAIAGVATTLCSAHPAHAQDYGDPYREYRVPRYREYRLVRPRAAPIDSFELQVGTGYTQGFGQAAPAMGLPSIAGAGLGVDLAAAYRATPHWSVGLQGEYAEYASEQNTAARGTTVNLGFTYHGAPFQSGDPWLRLGTGWRWLWSVNPPDLPTATLEGWEALKANVGYDIRLSDGVAIAPQLGADLTVFSWVTQAGYTTAFSQSTVGVFINAGIQGRFDIGPSAVPAAYVGRAR